MHDLRFRLLNWLINTLGRASRRLPRWLGKIAWRCIICLAPAFFATLRLPDSPDRER
jgi:hypothetical protein